MSLKLNPNIKKVLQKIYEDRFVLKLTENNKPNSNCDVPDWSIKNDGYSYMISPHVLQHINEWSQVSASGDITEPEPDPSLLFKCYCDNWTIYHFGCQCGGI